MKNIKQNTKKLRDGQLGFTIVELIVVIVVIGILAAITIVSFNGVTGRANTASAQTAANSLVSKLNLYNSENNTYPVAAGSITTLCAAVACNNVATLASSTWYSAQGTAFSTQAGFPPTASPGTSNAKYVWYVPASTTYNSNTGGCVYYWDFGANAIKSLAVGATPSSSCTGTGTAVAV